MLTDARRLALEADLRAAIQRLDDDAIYRLAHVALEIGFTREEMEAVFGPVVRAALERLYGELADIAAHEFDVPLAWVAVHEEADLAAGRLAEDLAATAEPVVQGLIATARLSAWGPERLAQELRQRIGLTAAQNRYVDNMRRELISDPGAVLGRKLRDARFDRTLRSGRPLAESEIDRMVDRYRQRWLDFRANGIAQLEVQRAENAARVATFEDAQNRGLLPDYARKYWIHMHDGKVRDSHLAIPILNPHGVPVDGTFVTPLGTLRYPLDPAGAPEDVIGCRCSLAFNVAPPVGAT